MVFVDSFLLLYVAVLRFHFLTDVVFGKHTDSFNFLFSLSSKVPSKFVWRNTDLEQMGEARSTQKIYCWLGKSKLNWP